MLKETEKVSAGEALKIDTYDELECLYSNEITAENAYICIQQDDEAPLLGDINAL